MSELNPFEIVCKAIEYCTNGKEPIIKLQQLSLDTNTPFEIIIDQIQEWSGVSVEEFFMYCSTNYAKSRLIVEQPNLFSAQSLEREEERVKNHEHRIFIQAMSNVECSGGGKNLSIKYSYHSTIFGEIIICSTLNGICYIAFHDSRDKAEKELREYFPGATCRLDTDPIHLEALSFFDSDTVNPSKIYLHVKCTDFQLRVWNELIKIPMGQLSSYNNIAATLGNTKLARAVGSAIGDNPVAYLIPCHRVVQSNGTMGGFRWGIPRKIAMIAKEAAQIRFTLGDHTELIRTSYGDYTENVRMKSV